MKKKLLIGTLMILLILICAGFLYLESILRSFTVSNLNSNYGLQLKYDEMNFGLTTGWITLRNPRLSDSQNDSEGILGLADRLGLGLDISQAFQGHFVLNQFESNGILINFRRFSEGDLNWSRVITRFLPNQKRQKVLAAKRSDRVTPSSGKNASSASAIQTSTKPIDSTLSKKTTPNQTKRNNQQNGNFPDIELKDSQFNYFLDNTAGNKIYKINVGSLNFDSKNHHLQIENGVGTRQNLDNPLLKITELDVQNLGQNEKDLEISGSDIQIQGKEIRYGQYDFSIGLKAWIKVYEDIDRVLSPDKTKKKQDIGSLVLKNVSADIFPATKSLDSIHVQAEEVNYAKTTKELTLNNIQINENNQSMVELKQLVLGGIQPGHVELKKVELNRLQIDIREDREGNLNIIRAIERVRSIVQSLVPKSGKVASATKTPADKFPNFSIGNTDLNLYASAYPQQKISIDAITFNPEYLSAKGSNLILSVSNGEFKKLITIPDMDSSLTDEKQWNSWNEVHIKQMQINSVLEKQGLDVIQSVSDWVKVSKRIGETVSSDKKKEKSPFSIEKLMLTQGEFRMVDRHLDKPIEHLFNPIQIKCSNVLIQDNTPPMALVNIKADALTPSNGRFSMSGRVSPSLNPVNMDATSAVQIGTLTAYESYYRESMPIGIEKSGFRLDGNIYIDDNKADIIFDIFLDQPEFSVSKSNLPAKIDDRAAIEALNGLKDKNGVIALRNNELKGNIKDPQFDFGTGITKIITYNLLNLTLSVLKLPFNVVETGTNILKKGAGSVGNMFMKIFDSEDQK